jgi:hypothetical protein
MAAITSLDAVRHADVRVARAPDLAYAACLNHAVIGLDEVALAAADFPLVMLKDAQTGRFHLAALFGFAPDRNLFVMNGRWHATYMPEAVMRYPFLLDDNGVLGLAIDEASGLLSVSGDRLFDSNGNPSAFARAVAERIRTMKRDRDAMTVFADTVVQHRLVRPLRLSLVFGDGGSGEIDGLYSADPAAITRLASDILVDLNRRGYLAAMHVMTASLAQLNRLQQLHNAQSSRHIAELSYGVDA